MNESVRSGIAVRSRHGWTIRGGFGLRDGLATGAVLVGVVLLVHGLVKGRLLHLRGTVADGLWTNILLLALVTVGIGVVAAVARRWSKHVLVAAFGAAVLIAFGWTGALWASLAFISFATLGEAILPGGPRSSVVSLSMQSTIGAACFVLVLGVTIHFRINTPLSFGALLLLPLLHRRALTRVIDICRTTLAPTVPPTVMQIAAATVLLFILALHLTGAGLPERYADGALYHLYFGQTLARLNYWPGDFHSLVWAVMPAGIDWLFSIGTMLAGEQGAKAFSFLVFLLLIANIHTAAVRRGVAPASALLLVALFASTPLAFIETTALFIENGLALFMLAAFTVLFMTECSAERRAMACVLMLSAAIATKLHGFAVVGPLGIAALWLLVTRGTPGRRLPVFVLGVIAIALGCEPYIYAWLVTGNPVFPFFNGIFHSPYYPPTNFVDYRWSQPAPYDLFYRETFHTERFGEFRSGAFGFQTVTLLLAAALAAVTTSWRAAAALALGLFYIFGISTGSTYARYLYPGVPLLMLGMACLLANRQGVEKVLSTPVRTLVVLVMSAVTVINLALFSTAGWPLAQNFWSGLFDAQKWQEAGDLSLPQLEMNRRASNDGLPAPRELLFNDAVSAGLAGTPLPVNWYNDTLVQRFRNAHTVDDIARIIRDYRVTHASFRFEQSQYGIDFNLVGRALEELGDPIARKDGLILYRIHPDVWLGPDLLVNTPLKPDQSAWQVRGNVDWIAPQGAMLGAGASLSQSPQTALKPDTLYRLSVEMQCTKPEQNLHAAVMLDRGDRPAGRFDDFPPCNVIGTVTRTLEFVTPSYGVTATLIVDNAQAAFLRATLREGYRTR